MDMCIVVYFEQLVIELAGSNTFEPVQLIFLYQVNII